MKRSELKRLVKQVIEENYDLDNVDMIRNDLLGVLYEVSNTLDGLGEKIERVSANEGYDHWVDACDHIKRILVEIESQTR